jgi:hypothetical protein
VKIDGNMSGNLRDELKAEYTILQAQYEAFDARALTIKSWSAPLLAGGIGLSVKEQSIALILALIVAALCLWLLEAIWKAFQYCYTDRIKLIEAWFRDQHSQEMPPFQIFTAWGEVWHRYYRYPKSLIPIMQQRFVWMPYLPIVVIGIVAILYVALTPRPTTAPSASTSKPSSFHSPDGRLVAARLSSKDVTGSSPPRPPVSRPVHPGSSF